MKKILFLISLIPIGNLCSCGLHEEPKEHTFSFGLSSGFQELREYPAKPTVKLEDQLLIYKSHTSSDQTENISILDETGDINDEILKRIAKPNAPSFRSENFTYTEYSSVQQNIDNGGTDTKYLVWKTNKSPTPENQIHSPYITQEMSQALSSALNEDIISFRLRAKGTPDLDIPLRSSYRELSITDANSSIEERSAAWEARRVKVNEILTGLKNEIQSSGGSISHINIALGDLHGKMSRSALLELTRRTDWSILDLSGSDEDRPTCDANCTMTNPVSWKLGEGHFPERIDSGRFLERSYDGEISNSSRHTHGDLVLSVVEASPDDGISVATIEDEYCGFSDLAATSTGGVVDCDSNRRIKRVYSCNPTCSFTTNSIDSDSTSSHGTMVTSIAAADFLDGQGKYQALGDVCFSSGDGINHCKDPDETNYFAYAATGMAPEATIHYYGGIDDGLNAAISTAMTQNTDVLNLSFASDSFIYQCVPSSSWTREESIENAFDDGIFVVASPGNINGGTATACNATSPGDTPKAFTVNALQTSTTGCAGNYQNCLLKNSKSGLGGATVDINGTSKTNAISIIDLLAPSEVRYAGDEAGNAGNIQVSGGFTGGTSAAIPHVAGSAILVKNWLLSVGASWINNPGRLHTVMLAMGDDYLHPTKGKNLSGFGRLKLRLLENNQGMGPWGYGMLSTTLNSSSYSYTVFDSPIPSGASVLKCVMMEAEDMINTSRGTNESTDNDEFSDVYLKVSLRAPVSGSCSSLGTSYFSEYDASYDLKHKVVINNASETLTNRCVEVELINNYIADSNLDVRVFCYYSGVDPHEPN